MTLSQQFKERVDHMVDQVLSFEPVSPSKKEKIRQRLTWKVRRKPFNPTCDDQVLYGIVTDELERLNFNQFDVLQQRRLSLNHPLPKQFEPSYTLQEDSFDDIAQKELATLEQFLQKEQVHDVYQLKKLLGGTLKPIIDVYNGASLQLVQDKFAMVVENAKRAEYFPVGSHTPWFLSSNEDLSRLSNYQNNLENKSKYLGISWNDSKDREIILPFIVASMCRDRSCNLEELCHEQGLEKDARARYRVNHRASNSFGRSGFVYLLSDTFPELFNPSDFVYCNSRWDSDPDGGIATKRMLDAIDIREAHLVEDITHNLDKIQHELMQRKILEGRHLNHNSVVGLLEAAYPTLPVILLPIQQRGYWTKKGEIQKANVCKAFDDCESHYGISILELTSKDPRTKWLKGIPTQCFGNRTQEMRSFYQEHMPAYREQQKLL